MKVKHTDVYRCPETGAPLHLESKVAENTTVLSGQLISAANKYSIVDGIPHFVTNLDERFSEDEKREFAYYEANSDAYDSIMDWLFESFYLDEDRVREGMVELLDLKDGNRVLETGCGTCRDSVRIAERLGPSGALFMQDLSPGMLRVGRKRMHDSAASERSPTCEFLVGDAARLPFADNYFDACFHFGGLNLFSDKAAAVREMARVVKPGGKVVFGDESMAPWMRDTETGKMLLNSNHLYRYSVPFEAVPEIAEDVCVRWIIGNCFYLVDFRVGETAPRVDLDKPILGFRGGTHRSRYYGALEGVAVETKAMAERAARASKMSMHDWLDQAVRNQASEDIKAD